MSIHAVPDPPPDRTSEEPAMKVAGVTSLTTAVTAIVGLLVTFGVGVTEKQGVAIVGAIVALAALAPLVSGWFTRGRVYAPATVARMLDANSEAAATQAAKERWPGPSHRLEP